MSRTAMRGLTDAVTLAQEGLLRDEILTALTSLPEDYRVMIVLADIEELSYREIADIVGCPLGTVMSRLHRARKLLQKDLMDQAVQMGIVPTPADGDENSGDEDKAPIDIASYRRRRQGVA